MSKSKDGLSAKEINRYWDAYFGTIDALFAAQTKLTTLEGSTMDIGERSGYRAARLRVEADIELMRARRAAFNAGTAKISPPDQDLVDAIVDVATQVAKQQAKRERANAIITMATTAMGEFAKIQPA